MRDFKEGDKVYYISSYGDNDVCTRVVDYTTMENVYFTNDGWMPRDRVFFLKELDNDEMPDVPDEVRYECFIKPGDDCLILDGETNQDSCRITVHQDLGYGNSEITHIALSPESMLDLAHDLTRMALKIKRSQSGE